ncbi:MAG: AI-2E family transporter [Candidatus Sericytochromatia bacterium]
MDRKLFFTLLVTFLLGALGYLLYQVFQPFLMSLLWASVLVTITYPLYQKLLERMPERKELAALLMCIGLTLLLVLPISLLGLVLVRDLREGAQALSQNLHTTDFEALLKPDSPLLQHPLVIQGQLFLKQYVDLESLDLRAAAINAAQRVSQFMLSSSSGFLGAFSGTLLLLALVELNMFFLFCDGREFVSFLRRLIPVAPETQELVLGRAREVVKATIYGSVGTAVTQGLVGGLIFLLLGLPSAVLWAVVMTLASFLPMVGTSLVWAPAAIWFFFNGHPIKAVLLALSGVLIIGTVDNIVRPILIRSVSSKDNQLNTLVLLFAVLGGIRLFGFLGIVISPLLVVLFLTLLELVRAALLENSAQAPSPLILTPHSPREGDLGDTEFLPGPTPPSA